MPKQKTLSNEANILLEQHLTELGLKFIPEVPFCAGRKWRFDYVLTDSLDLSEGKFAIEIEGGVYAQGRHTRGAGYEKDMEKHNNAIVLGWKLLRFSTGQVLDGTAREFIREHCL